MTFKEIQSDLKAGKYAPIYFLHGNESYYIDVLSNFFESKILSEAEKSFNLTILYGKDIDHKTVIDNARRYPMMAPYQVVIIKEAQNMKQIQSLDIYIENPLDTTLLVMCYKHKKLDKRTKFAKLLNKHGIVYESKTLYDNQVPGWIVQFLKNKKYSISDVDAALIAEYLGNDLSKISNELNKLIINLPKGKMISKSDIQSNIGISKEFNVFEFQKVLGSRDMKNTYKILEYFMSNTRNNPLVMITAALYNYFSKIYMLHSIGSTSDREVQKVLGLSSPYFISEYKRAAQSYNKIQAENVISILRKYDLKSKGVDRVNTTEASLMQEMVFHILNV